MTVRENAHVCTLVDSSGGEQTYMKYSNGKGNVTIHLYIYIYSQPFKPHYAVHW